MIRPASIVWFERLYLAGLVIGLINTAISWGATSAKLAAQPGLGVMAAWYQPVGTLIGVAIPLLLWYFIARRGSVLAKWVMVAVTALVTYGMVSGFWSGRSVLSLGKGMGLVTLAVDLAAAWMLFRPDTRLWFGETEETIA